ncbi:MAG: hypothetical protein KF895_03260 [Parvibaculum sp.]|nr:hypothetical protein [Parvibaculum sp.]
MPATVKLQVVINQEGRCKATGERLGLISEVEFDHRPALYEREFDPEARDGQGDTVPAANDPAYIDAIKKHAHKGRTARDAGRRAKEARITGQTKTRDKSDRFAPPPRGVDVLRPENPEKKPGRKYHWPKRELKSRGFPKKNGENTRGA